MRLVCLYRECDNLHVLAGGGIIYQSFSFTKYVAKGFQEFKLLPLV
jgi:hypothetical protein